MIEQIITMLILNIWFVYTSYGILTPALLIQQENKINPIIKTVFQSLVVSVIKFGFLKNNNIYITNELQQTKGKVDILMCNHIGSIDMLLIIAILKSFGINNWIAIAKSDLMYFAGFGLQFASGDHIKLDRDWKEDQLSICNQLDKLTEGTLVIFPEGTRFEPEKLKEGQQYSKDNSYPIYNHTLVPKAKGLHAVINHLQKSNKLGSVTDMSIVLKNFFHEKAYMNDLFKKDTGDIFVITRELKVQILEDQTEFKNWLLNEWKKKDDLIDMHTNLVYQKLQLKRNIMSELVSLLFVIVISYKLFGSSFRYYFLGSIVIAYAIIYIRRNKHKQASS